MTLRRWGFIGCGNVAQALISGFVNQNIVSPQRITATNRTASKLARFTKQIGIASCPSNLSLVDESDVVVLATKPQDIVPVLREISPHIRSHHTVISLAAGVDSVILKKYLSEAHTLFRVMPNTPVLIQRGIFGVLKVKGPRSAQEDLRKILENVGQVFFLKNDDQVASITAAVASGSGFVFYLMEIFQDWLQKNGFSQVHSRALAVATFSGSAALAEVHSQTSIGHLREAVTSRKGTTHEGLLSFKRNRVKPRLQTGLSASKRRSREISAQLHKSIKSS